MAWEVSTLLLLSPANCSVPDCEWAAAACSTEGLPNRLSSIVSPRTIHGLQGTSYQMPLLIQFPKRQQKKRKVLLVATYISPLPTPKREAAGLQKKVTAKETPCRTEGARNSAVLCRDPTLGRPRKKGGVEQDSGVPLVRESQVNLVNMVG